MSNQSAKIYRPIATLQDTYSEASVGSNALQK